MSVRCNTDSVGVSWPEAKEQTGHRVTQLIIPSYFPIPCFPLVCSQVPLWICVVAEKEIAQKGFKTSNEENSTIKGFLVFSGVFWRSSWPAFCWDYIGSAEFYAHKIKETITIARCALYLIDLLHQKSHKDRSYCESLR